MASDDGAIVERMAAAIVSLYQNVVTQVRRDAVFCAVLCCVVVCAVCWTQYIIIYIYLYFALVVSRCWAQTTHHDSRVSLSL